MTKYIERLYMGKKILPLVGTGLFILTYGLITIFKPAEITTIYIMKEIGIAIIGAIITYFIVYYISIIEIEKEEINILGKKAFEEFEKDIEKIKD